MAPALANLAVTDISQRFDDGTAQKNRYSHHGYNVMVCRLSSFGW
jgi:hypothetical protein